MKTIVLFAVIIAALVVSSYAQTLEHFKITPTQYGWKLKPAFDKDPQSGVNGIMGDESGSILKLIKTAIGTLPEEIKQELAKQDVRVSFYFNPKGEIFYVYFMVRKTDPFFMTDKQWLKVYYTIRNLKVDISKLRLMDNFEWGDGGTYPISKYLREMK